MLESMRFLVVRACAIGDFVLHLPALRALANAYPMAEFVFVGYPETLALARAFLPVVGIHSVESPPFSQLFHGPVSSLRFDAAWVWMKDAALATNIARSGVREVFHADPFPTNGHAADHLLATLNLQAPPLPDLWDPGSMDVVLHPGSGSARKVWPRFEELAQSLPQARVLLGPCESPLQAPNPRLEGLRLAEVSELLRRCRLFIGNDSGITHIAAYWGTPAVALFGPTDPAVWGPVGRRVKVLHRDSLADISLADVRKLI